MPEVVVVPEEAGAGGDTATAFAAGVAAAEAAQASEDAAEAVAVAEAAAETAEAAASTAIDAVMTAERHGVSPEELAALRSEFISGLEEVRGMVADLATGPAESELTPERVERENGPGPDDDGQEEEPAHKGGRYGNQRWFSR